MGFMGFMGFIGCIGSISATPCTRRHNNVPSQLKLRLTSFETANQTLTAQPSLARLAQGAALVRGLHNDRMSERFRTS